MDNRPIAIFDSGFGGLTAYAALRRMLPRENILFFADNARAPYGSRTAGQLRLIARQDLDFAASTGAKVILAACGTVSANAPDILEAYPLFTLGVLEDGVKALAAAPGDAPLGIIATAASIKSGRFAERLGALCPGREIVPMACPDFVPLIESGRCAPDDSAIREAVSRYLRPLRDAGVGSILLGCTHYGLISEAITAYMGDSVRLVSAAESAAQALCGYVKAHALEGEGGTERFFTSGSAAEFEQKAALFLGRAVHGAEHVPVMELTEER